VDGIRVACVRQAEELRGVIKEREQTISELRTEVVQTAELLASAQETIEQLSAPPPEDESGGPRL
jgi:hypothetical protein